MFDFIGRMFGSSKAGEKIIDGAISGIDKLWYTDEEKAQDAAQAKREVMTVYMSWMESTQGSRIARRLLALIAALMWAVQQIGAVILQLAAVWHDDAVVIGKLVQGSEILQAGANDTSTLVAVVFAFYFGGPAAVDISKNALNAFAAKGKYSDR